jgi:hypothetical protein
VLQRAISRRAGALVLVLGLSLSHAKPTHPAAVGERVEIGGYIKSFAVGFDQPTVDGSSTETGGWLWAINNRARANLGVAIAEWLTLDVSYDLSFRIQDDELFVSPPIEVFVQPPVYRFSDLDRYVWPKDPGKGDNVALLQNLDRLFFTITARRFDIYLGRQAIAWGSAKAVNPTDILAPFLYTDIDTEDRVGIDAVRVRVPLGMLAEVDAGYVAGEDFKREYSAAFLRSKFYTLNTDFVLLATAFRENALAGIDITRNIGGASTWCEAAYVWADAADGRTSESEGMDYLRVSIGADYNFDVGSGLYGFFEYHYNGAGANDPKDYLTNVVTNTTAYVDGAVYLLGRHYILPGVSYQLTPLTSLFVQTLISVTDGSFLLAPVIQHSVTENVYLSAGGYGAWGDNPAVMPVGIQEVPVLNSEFGSYGSRYWLFLDYYY